MRRALPLPCSQHMWVPSSGCGGWQAWARAAERRNAAGSAAAAAAHRRAPTWALSAREDRAAMRRALPLPCSQHLRVPSSGCGGWQAWARAVAKRRAAAVMVRRGASLRNSDALGSRAIRRAQP